MRRRTTVAVLALAIPALSAEVRAQEVIYDNGAPTWGVGNEITRFIQAQDFILEAPRILGGVRFWGFLVAPDAYTGSIFWQIYGNDVDEPGALLAGGLVSAALMPAGGSAARFQIDFGLPNVALGPGTYWLGLHNGPLDVTDLRGMAWSATALNATQRSRVDGLPFGDDVWSRGTREHAFQILAPVPEPTTVALVGAGLVGLVGAGRAQRRSRR